MTISRRFTPVVVLVFVATALIVMPATAPVHAAKSPAITGKVGFLFSDFTTSLRWYNDDRPFFIADLKKLDPGVSVVVYDAKAAQINQDNQAKSALTLGVKALIDVPVADASGVVRAAHANNPPVPVLAYDRLISGAKVDAYASFNGYAVGVQQGKFLKSHVKKGSTIIEIAGSPTDNNALLFHNGARSVLNPLFKSGYFKLGYSKFTPNWDDAAAQNECASALNKLNNNVQGVLSANDGMAVACETALKAQHLNGKVVVTGQDATVPGLQAILLGNQGMTVYKPVKVLAKNAAHIVDLWLHGKTYTSSKSTNNGTWNVPSSIAGVITVTKKNMKSTVIKDGYATRAQICKGIPASACKGL